MTGDQIWIEVRDNSGGRYGIALLRIQEREVGDEGQRQNYLAEPEVIGNRATINRALSTIATLYPALVKQREGKK